MRQALFSVCRQWRNGFKLHLWVHPTSAYCKALQAKNYHLANSIWDFAGDCIDYHSETVVDTVFWYGQQLHRKRLITRDDFDSACHDNLPIRCASLVGYADTVKLLLQDSRVDPSARDNYAIRRASGSGHTDIVQLLLQEPGVDPSADDNYAICYASANGHVDTVKLLLRDARVDPSAENDCAIRFAIAYGHAHIVQLLKEHKRLKAIRS